MSHDDADVPESPAPPQLGGMLAPAPLGHPGVDPANPEGKLSPSQAADPNFDPKRTE